MSPSPTLPFDGGGSGSRPTATETPSQRKIWTVSELLASTRERLERSYPAVWVRGEISGFREVNRHWYFDLKDDRALLHMVMFGGDNFRVPFEPEDGLEVLACGRLTLFDRSGQFQLIANVLEPVGWGALQLAYEQLKRRLEAEGLFASERKRPLPGLPSCVGVVTSRESAAWRDMVRVWTRRDTRLRVVLAHARVQGDDAAAEIAEAIRRLDDWGEAEVLIVGRGGGSREDLWAFNEEPVARAMVECSVPVIAAVGHEIDWTIADHVADVRAATPTEAAELVARARVELIERATTARRRAEAALRHRLHRARSSLEHRTLHRALDRPARTLQAHQQRLDEAWQGLAHALEAALGTRRRRLGTAGATVGRHAPRSLLSRRREQFGSAMQRLSRAMRGRVQHARERRAALSAQLDALSPLRVLGRGYALCRDDRGRILRSAADAPRGARVRVRLHEGELGCRVEESRTES